MKPIVLQHILALLGNRPVARGKASTRLLIRGFGVQVPGGAPSDAMKERGLRSPCHFPGRAAGGAHVYDEGGA